MRSVFITGAPGVGKTTTYNYLRQKHAFHPLPNHLTRPPRCEEIDGIDALFISVEAFRHNLHKGLYLEGSMEEAEHLGVYYGSPRDWRDHTADTPTPFVATPANTLILQGMCNHLKEAGRRDSVVWANLVAPMDIRRTRMEPRGYDPIHLEQRLTAGVSHGIQNEADLNIDTQQHGVEAVVDLILQQAFAQ